MKIILKRNEVDRDLVNITTITCKSKFVAERTTLWAVVHSDMFSNEPVIANLLEEGKEVTMLLRFTEDSE